MRKLYSYILIVVLAFSATACADESLRKEGCWPVENHLDFENNVDFKEIGINDGGEKKGIMVWITDRVTEILEDASQEIYEEISTDTEYGALIGITMTLAIMFYAMAIMLGIAQASGYAIFLFSVKIILIYNFAVEWDTIFEPFVVQTFESFVTTTVELSGEVFHDYSVVGGDNSNSPSMFAEIDKMISILWDFRMMEIALASFTTGTTGFFWGIMIILWMWVYLLAIIMLVKTYLLALIARYVLYALAPIFLIFLLFNQTKSLFDGYLEQLINFTLQPIFIFIFAGLFHMLMAGFANELLIDNMAQLAPTATPAGVTGDPYIGIAYVPLKEGGSAGGNDLHFWKFCVCGDSGPTDCDHSEKPTINIDIWVLLSVIILSYLMYAMLSWVLIIASRLSAGIVTIGDVNPPGFQQVKSLVPQAGRAIASLGKAPR